MTSEDEPRPAPEPAPEPAPAPEAAAPGDSAPAPPSGPPETPAQDAPYSPYTSDAPNAPAASSDADLPPLQGPAAPPYPYWVPPKPGTNGFAVAALVVGIVGLCLCFGFLGIIFGHIARRQIEETGQAGAGLATAGIVLGWIAVALVVLRVIVIGSAGPTLYGY
jgi:hypothetical protein